MYIHIFDIIFNKCFHFITLYINFITLLLLNNIIKYQYFTRSYISLHY